MNQVLYLCDRRVCEKCSPDCHHTTDISHAQNFKKEFDDYFESTKPTLVVEARTLMSKEDLKQIRDDILEQMKDGVVVLPHCLKGVVVANDIEVKDE